MTVAFDWDTILAILILVAFAIMIWRGGSKNPVGTGALQKQLNTIGSDVNQLKTSVGGLASKAELEGVRTEMEQIERRTASSGEILALEGKINAMTERVGGRCDTLGSEVKAAVKAADRTEAAVQRIEALFISRGIDR